MDQKEFLDNAYLIVDEAKNQGTQIQLLGAQCQPGGPLYGLQNNLGGRMVIFPGGVPVWRDGKLIGAVGASGGSVEQDHACATAGEKAI